MDCWSNWLYDTNLLPWRFRVCQTDCPQIIQPEQQTQPHWLLYLSTVILTIQKKLSLQNKMEGRVKKAQQIYLLNLLLPSYPAKIHMLLL